MYSCTSGILFPSPREYARLVLTNLDGVPAITTYAVKGFKISNVTMSAFITEQLNKLVGNRDIDSMTTDDMTDVSYKVTVAFNAYIHKMFMCGKAVVVHFEGQAHTQSVFGNDSHKYVGTHNDWLLCDPYSLLRNFKSSVKH